MANFQQLTSLDNFIPAIQIDNNLSAIYPLIPKPACNKVFAWVKDKFTAYYSWEFYDSWAVQDIVLEKSSHGH